MAGGNFDPMEADPNIGAGIGNMADQPDAPAEDPAMDDVDPNLGSDYQDDDSTSGIIDQLSDEDKEAVRNYAKSLLSRDEGQPEPGMEDMGGGEQPAAPAQGQGVMMEITKGRLKRVQRHLSETFRDNERQDDESDRKQKKVNKNFGKKTPFDSPLA